MPIPFPLNPQLSSLPVYRPGRPIAEVARELGLDPQTVIKLASNENPFGPSRLALRAMRQALAQAHLYPDGSAFYLKEKLARHLGVTPEHLILGNGSNEVLEMLGHAVLSPTVSTIASQYCFAVYPIVTALFGARFVEVPAKNYGHDLKAMLSAITGDTRLVFAANPNNPTGTVVSAAELSQFIAAVPPNVLVVLDEAYIEFLDKPLNLVPRIVAGELPNVILLRTFSKIYGLAGLRIGYGIAQPEFIAVLEKIRQPFNINSISQAGALAALDDTRHVERTRRGNRRALRFFAKAFKERGLEFIPGAANFILVRVGAGGSMFERLQRKGVITRPMASYGLPEWLRISMGTLAENERCLHALLEALPESLAA